MTIRDSDIHTEVYRVSAPNTVGILECVATHRPTGLSVSRRGTAGSVVLTAVAREALRDLVGRYG